MSNKSFADLPIGGVFQTMDGRMSESATWVIFVKTSPVTCQVLVRATGKDLVVGDSTHINDIGVRHINVESLQMSLS